MQLNVLDIHASVQLQWCTPINTSAAIDRPALARLGQLHVPKADALLTITFLACRWTRSDIDLS